MIKKNTKSKHESVVDIHKQDLFDQIKNTLLNDKLFINKLIDELEKNKKTKKQCKTDWVEYLEIHQNIF